MIKVNWDAAVDKKKGCVSLGIISRDCEGRVLAARCVTQHILVEPTVVEAMAGLHAVVFSRDVGYVV
jgi:hypothetical protein